MTYVSHYVSYDGPFTLSILFFVLIAHSFNIYDHLYISLALLDGTELTCFYVSAIITKIEIELLNGPS